MIFNCSAVGTFQSKTPCSSASKTGSTAVSKVSPTGWMERRREAAAVRERRHSCRRPPSAREAPIIWQGRWRCRAMELLSWKRWWDEPQIAQIQEFAVCGFPSTFHPTGEVTVSGKGLPIRVIRVICDSYCRI